MGRENSEGDSQFTGPISFAFVLINCFCVLPAAVFDEFFDKIIDEHIQSDKGQDNKVKDFVDVMLSFVGSEEYEYRYAIRLNGYFSYNNLVDTFRAPKESTGDEESPNGVGNYCGYVEEGEGIRLGQVGVFGYGYKGKHEAPSSGTVTNATPIEGRLHVWIARSMSGANKKMIEALTARKKEEYLKNPELGRHQKFFLGTVLKQQSCLAIVDSMEFVESNPLFQNPKSMSYSLLILQLGVGLAFGRLICKDKFGCAGNSS
ncbi:hypothetical protein JHK85_034343 [Glycine max]|nr:hypothetical protein JHK85_034343 [Glycine max]